MSRQPPNAEKPLPDGPWCDEPDREEGRALGLPYILNRGPVGAWCGYVGVPPGHPWHGKHYDDIDDAQVHGGLTYANACHGHICHVPKPGDADDVWWLGFDCGHYLDEVPAYSEELRMCLKREGMVYRDIGYVRRETRNLAAQARLAQGWSAKTVVNYEDREASAS